MIFRKFKTLFLIIFVILVKSAYIVRSEDTNNQMFSTLPPPSTTNSLNNLNEALQKNNEKHISEEDLNKLAKILKVNKKKVPIFKKIGHKINTLIDRVEADNGSLKPEFLVQEFIPDPLPVKDIEAESSGFFTSYSGQFTNVLLHGISGVKINSIRSNLGNLTAKIAIIVPNVYLTGDYTLEGKVTFIDFEGKGKFRMNISEIEIDCYGNLNRTVNEETDKKVLQIGNIELDVSPGNMDLEFENLSVFGSETAGETIVSMMSGLIFSAVKSSVLERTSEKIRARINQRLQKISLDILESEDSETLFDDLLAHITKKMGKKIEPLQLPAFSRNFSTKLAILNVDASINVQNGRLYGFTTFARTGDIIVTYEEGNVTIEADVGFRNLTGSYDWSLQIFGRGPSGSASLAIRKVAAYMRIKQKMKRGSVAKLERFRVEEIDHVWMDMNGLGVWDYLLEIVVNTVSNAFRVTIANILASTVAQIVQEELEQAHISFIP